MAKKKKDKGYCRVTKTQAEKIKRWESIWDFILDKWGFLKLVGGLIFIPLASSVIAFSILSGLLTPVVIGATIVKNNPNFLQCALVLVLTWVLGVVVFASWTCDEEAVGKHFGSEDR